MTTYRNIHGRSIRAVATDPTAEVSEGEIWYNTGSDAFKSIVSVEAWASGSPLITAKARYTQGGVGTQTAALAVGGYSTGIVTETEEYNGSGWSAGGALGTGRYGIYTAGTQTAGLAATGKGPSGVVTNVEEYNGSSWSEVNNNSTGRFLGSSCGTQTAGLIYGGAGPNNQTEEYDGTNWTNGGNLNTARNTGFSSGTQTAGLIAGGGPGSGNTAASEHYDGSSWTTVNSMNTARRSGAPSIAGLRTSSLAFGGFTTTMVTNTEAYDGTTWTNSPTLGTARYGLGGAGDSSGSALAFGGQNNSGTTYSLTEEFTKSANVITAGAWASGGNMGTTRFQAAGAGSQTAGLAFGGETPGGDTANTEEYNGSSWSEQNNLPATTKDQVGFGTQTAGVSCSGAPNTITYKYDGTSWTSSGALNTGRTNAAGCGSQTAGVIFGGYPNVTATEEFNGSSWTTNPNAMPESLQNRFGTGTQTAALAAYGGPPFSNTTFEYDGSSWTSGGAGVTPRADARGGGTQTDAIAGGGYNPSHLTSVEGYDGTAWSTRPSLANSHTGGCSGQGAAPASANWISGGNPATNTTEEFTGETSALNVKTLTQS